MKEFEFDVRLEGTVRVRATSEKLTRQAMAKVIAYSEPTQEFLDGFNEESIEGYFTHFSLGPDDSVHPQGAVLVEVDGEPV